MLKGDANLFKKVSVPFYGSGTKPSGKGLGWRQA